MIMREMYKNMGICDEVYDYCDNIIMSLHDRFEEIDKNAEYNQMKVIKAMQDNKVAEMHLSGTTGYGYNDDGRDTLEKVYSDIFKTEDALVRPQIICGTHALNVALSSNLRPGDELLSPVGKPYDTMDEIIGISLLQDVDSLLFLAFGDELEGCLGEQATVGITHTHGCLEIGRASCRERV